MKKTRKINTLAVGALMSAIIPVAAVVSCGGTSNPWKNSKEIVIAVDGAQKDMYNQAIKLFSNSDSYKKGYRIRTVEKDVFGSLDMAKTVGYTDKNVADLFYMPQDRMTDLLQQKALMPWSDKQRKELFQGIGLDLTKDKKEIDVATRYGQAPMRGKPVFFAMAHNKEGLGISTTAPYEIAKKEINENGLVGLQNKAEGLFQLQNMWYGSGFFARPVEGAPGKVATDFILYGDKSNWNSGFDKQNEHHKVFKTITDDMADMWYEPLAKAYGEKKATKALIGENWFNNKITPDELQNFFQSDGGAINNMLIKSIKEGNLKYMYAGTWDAQNLAKQGIKNMLNVSSDIDGTNGNDRIGDTFVQATGTWSYGINARNNGASQERINAIMELLKDIYNFESFTQYFIHDTKVPFFEDLQKKVGENSKKTVFSKETKKAVDLLKDETMLKSLNDANTKKEAKTTLSAPDDDSANNETNAINSLEKWLNEYGGTYNELNDFKVSNDWKSKKQKIQPDEINVGGITTNDDVYNDANLKYQDIIGALNANAILLGTSIEDAHQGNPEWQVNAIVITNGKKNKNWSKIALDDKEETTTAHARKVAKLWTGFNHDLQDEKKAFTDKFIIDLEGVKTKEAFTKSVKAAKANFDKIVNESINKAKTFVKDMNASQTKPNDQKIKKVVTQYLNNYWNEELKSAKYKFTQENVLVKIEFKGTGDNKKTFPEIQKIIKNAVKATSVNGIFELLTSKSGDKRGEFKSQPGRFDRINPQFGSVWTLWNEQAFGNKVWLKDTITKIFNSNPTNLKEAQNQLKIEFENKMHDLIKSKIKQIIAASGSGKVNLD